jgi:phage repressor protein C with HTH and peptisase S24 domain
MKTLKERLGVALQSSGRTAADLARSVKKTESAVSQWLNGQTKTLHSDSLLPAAEFLGVSPTWLATGLGQMKPLANREIGLTDNPDYPAVRRVSIKAQAGVSGYAVEHLEDTPPIVFRKDWYVANGYEPAKLLALGVTGQSMEPTLFSGDLIVINTTQVSPRDGAAFAVSYEGEIVVKRLVRDEGDWWLSSDNSDQRRYPRKRCTEATQIIGEVIYKQSERI